MAHGALNVAELQQRAREAGPGAHVGTRFEETPELALILREALWPERQLPRLDPLGVIIPCLLHRPGGLFGEEDIAVGAERRDAERLPGERDPGAGGGPLPGLVHHLLRLRRIITATAPSTERRQEGL